MVPIETTIINITTQNYGITEVLGANNVYSGKNMDCGISFTSGVWHTTGTDPRKTSWYQAAVKTLESYGVTVDDDSPVANQTVYSTDQKSEIKLTYGRYDVNGKRFLTSYQITTYDDVYTNANKTVVNTKQSTNFSIGQQGESGSSTYVDQKYGSAWLDFCGLGTDYTVQSLYGQAFNTICSQGCGNHYNIVLSGDQQSTTNADGVNYSFSYNSRKHPTLTINISGCGNGEDIVQAIMSAVNSEPGFTSHRNQLAYDEANPSRIYIYDNTAGITNDLFVPVEWTGTETTTTTVTTWVEVPNMQRFYLYEDYIMNIQAGANTEQLIALRQPILNSINMNLSVLNIISRDGATAAIECCDFALGKLNSERSRIGALVNRFEHTYSNNTNTSENLQSAESALRDADMADEMVAWSAANILQQAGQSMLAQANSINRGILTLLNA